MTPQTAVLMSQYSRWMNQRIFEAAAKLTADTLRADTGAFFGSILGTLNHLAVGDTLWLHRFAQHPHRFEALAGLSEFERPTSLRQTVSSDLAGLGDYRRRLDELIAQWVAEIRPEHLTVAVAYTSMAGASFSKEFGPLLQHFFNHQTHHRGQVSTLLYQAGVDVGVTDLLALIPESVDKPASL
jgi:uncharacterized damage-inducible protein DinB